MAYSSFDPDNLKEPYAIVQFEGKEKSGKLCIDLVLKKWLTKRGKKNICKYPCESEYHLRDQYLEKLKSPKKSWSCYPYKFIIGAANVEQGHRRLHRAQFTKNCDSTDIESEKSDKAPSVLSKSRINEILYDKVSMRSTKTANTPAGTQSEYKSQCSRDGQDSKSTTNSRDTSDNDYTDSENEHESISSTYSSPQKRLKETSNFQSKQSSSNSEQFCVRYPKNIDNSESEHNDKDDSELNLLTPNKRLTSTIQLQTSPKRDKTKGLRSEKLSNKLPERDVATADNVRLFQDLKCYIDTKLDNLRDRIAYDLRTKITDLKNTIIGTNLTAAGPNLTTSKTRLSIKVPIETLDEFLNYEDVLKNNKDEVEALRMFFRVLIYSQSKANSCIATIMTATLEKTVELEYSGFGRSVAGHSKRNFSTTQTCTIMKEAIIDKLGEGVETQNLQSKISKWLSGAKDRKGGRKERQSQVRRRSKSL